MTEDEAKPYLLRSALESARETIKACLLINAGSAAAMIGFLGHLITQKEFELAEKLAPANKWFVVGVVAAILGHALSYGSNLFFVYWPWRWGQNARYAAVFVTFLSMILFACGAWTAADSLTSINKTKSKPTTTIQSTK